MPTDPKVVPLRIVPPGQLEVDAKVISKLRELLADAEKGRVTSFACVVIDEQWAPQIAFAGNMPAFIMAEYTRQLHSLFAGWSLDTLLDGEWRYTDPINDPQKMD
jgi:hypothetical protein